MGNNPRRGNTYSWIHTHLADTQGQASPRSFMLTLRYAAAYLRDSIPTTDTAIDHRGIRVGVGKASEIRVGELAEDHPWISDVLQDLNGLVVPCSPSDFTKRWGKKRRIAKIKQSQGKADKPSIPLEIRDDASTAKLLDALENLNVLERRDNGKINVPDIFRLAARLRRRGGTPPSNRA